MNPFSRTLIDILKGAISAAIAAGVIAFMQYLGAHIGDVTEYTAMTASAASTIRFWRT